MKIRILHIVPGLSAGDGVTKVLYSLLKNQDRERFTPWVCSLVPVKLEDIRAFEESNIRVMWLDGISSSSPRYLSTNMKVMWHLCRILRQEEVVAVHTHNFFASCIGQMAAVLVGVPIRIVTVHGDVFPWHFGPVCRVLSAFVDRVVCISRSVQEFVVNSGAANPSKITVIYNGITQDFHRPKDTDLKRSELSIPDNSPVIGMVAALEKIKGHEFLIQAAPTILQAYPSARFLIVGGDPWFEPDTPKMLRRLVHKLNIQDNVIFAGQRDDIADLLSLMDVFVFPPLKAGFGLALAEAMYMQKAIVASSVGAIPEVLGDDETGKLVPPGDVTALAEAILMLLKDRKKGEKMGRRARKRVVSSFSAEVMAANYERLYDKLCADKELSQPCAEFVAYSRNSL